MLWSATGALHAGLHDAGACAGHDHPADSGQLFGDSAGLLVERIVGLGAGRSEDRHLANVAVRLEDGEGVAHLGDGRAGDLEIEQIGLVGDQTEDLGNELFRDSKVLRNIEFAQCILDALVG